MDAVTLSDLGPILAAVLGPMLLFVAASMRYQHIDGTRTRDLIAESNEKTRDLITESNEKNRDLITESNEKNRDLITESDKETRKLIEKNRDLIEKNRDLIEKSNKETRDLIDKNHKELSHSLGDARERLARMEGYLRISPPPEQRAGDGDGNARAA